MKVPCRGCPDRLLGCHSNCQRYKAYRAELEELRKAGKVKMDAARASFDGRERVTKSRNKAPKYNP